MCIFIVNIHSYIDWTEEGNSFYVVMYIRKGGRGRGRRRGKKERREGRREKEGESKYLVIGKS